MKSFSETMRDTEYIDSMSSSRGAKCRTKARVEGHPAVLTSLLAIAATQGVQAADEVYKSVDAQGHVIYSDRADPSKGQVSAVQIGEVPALPREIHVCWTNCFTLSRDKDLYRRVDGTDETWTVERFTSKGVILHRHDAPADWNGFSTDVTYEGQVANDRLTRVTVNGSAVPDIQAAWGAALDTLPGNNAERDRRNLASPRATLPSTNPPTSGTLEPTGDTSQARITEAPPPLRYEEQPPCTDDGSLWAPGSWAWSSAGYYWVPGAWVRPPRLGWLWTPGYWSWGRSVFVFHPGYWGRHVGFYGGINYGYGYLGSGFVGGRWVGNSFAYNRAVSNVDLSAVRHTYREAVASHGTLSRVSFQGGPGGNTAVPIGAEIAAASEPHLVASSSQRQWALQAARNPALRAEPIASPATVVRSRPSTSQSANHPAPTVSAKSTAADSATPAAVTPRPKTPAPHVVERER